MKHTLTLAAWNFRLARRYLLALWGIFAAQQLALVVFRICWQGAAGMGLASHYYVTMQIFTDPGSYLLTGLAAGLATHSSRRARSGYTWATLPRTPGQKFGAKAITIAAAEVVFTAWQFVWRVARIFTPSPRWKFTWPASCTARLCPHRQPVRAGRRQQPVFPPAAAPPLAAGDLAGHPGPVRPAAGRAGHRAWLAQAACVRRRSAVRLAVLLPGDR